MPTPSAAGGPITEWIAIDAHIGGQHGWVEWVRVVEDEQCMIATPLNPSSQLESWRPVFEFGGGGFEWAVHTSAWADEWVEVRNPVFVVNVTRDLTFLRHITEQAVAVPVHGEGAERNRHLATAT